VQAFAKNRNLVWGYNKEYFVVLLVLLVVDVDRAKYGDIAERLENN
jgi:hypothetical protein